MAKNIYSSWQANFLPRSSPTELCLMFSHGCPVSQRPRRSPKNSMASSLVKSLKHLSRIVGFSMGALCRYVSHDAEATPKTKFVIFFLSSFYVLCLIQVGVVPEKNEALRGPLVAESLVARCLWESHWREEWCGVYRTCIEFYAPLTQKPCLELCKSLISC